MDNENAFWIAMWRTIAVAFVCLVAAISGCTAFQSNRVVQLTKGGADPITAACAVRGNGNEPMCVLSAQKAKQ